jgi:hypothetical protein
MKRRGFIQAVAGCVAGLLAPKAKGEHLPDAGKKVPPLDFRLHYKDKALADNPEAQAWLKEFESCVKTEMRKPPAPAPGQVWESPQGAIAVFSAVWPDDDLVWYTCPLEGPFGDDCCSIGRLKHWRYLGHIRDLATLARCTPYEPLMPAKWPRDGVEGKST